MAIGIGRRGGAVRGGARSYASYWATGVPPSRAYRGYWYKLPVNDRGTIAHPSHA